ncbi:MAG: DUF1800 domain-containing protein, partial [Steroidobacteraceae bacterium]|nr:DUF1800 domain-containing protein [Steroidobacteraceae bacterium]MDW8259697.1 DUF1800 domain-containing protein [Gammaproteobacteria bacterium]
MRRIRSTFASGLAACLVAACLVAACGGGSGGGGSPPPPPPPPPITKADAYRFLIQASFGPTESEAQRVIALGYEGWIDEQLALP